MKKISVRSTKGGICGVRTQRRSHHHHTGHPVETTEHVQAAFLDLSKAYDRVGIPGLIGKLSALGFSCSSLSWLRSFLTNRKQCVCVNGFKSSWQSPKSGIPQGTVLGPVLFLTFINDLPQSLTCECSIFADDSTAYTSGKDTQLTCRKLSLNLDYASDWASSWACYSALRRVNISKLHQKLRTSINLMVTSSCTVRTFLG